MCISDEMTMSVEGWVVEVCEEVGLPSFKVQTKLGCAYVWVWEELCIDFRVGMKFEVEDAPTTFHEGQVLAVLRPEVSFWLDGMRYEVLDPSGIVLP